MIYYEDKHTELKVRFSKSIFKTISAFANYNDGRVVIGVDDDGNLIGVDNLEETCDKIERAIIDCFSPVPDFSLEIDHIKKTITICVQKGEDTPYFYNNKAYIRPSKSTFEVDRNQLKRLILEGNNQTFESLPNNTQEFSFKSLASLIAKQIGIKNPSSETYRTFGLINSQGEFTNAAALCADNNNFRIIDIVKHDQSKDKILFRKTFEKCSIFDCIENAIEVFKDFYSFEQIEGMKRKRIFTIPEIAFRESIINALIHRIWDVDIYTKITLHDDFIEIMSPGGLPNELSEDDFLNKRISVPRNIILVSLFYRLHYIERLGSGVYRINRSYKDSANKPKFEIDFNHVNVILPVLKDKSSNTPSEIAIIDALKNSKGLSSSQLASITKFSKSKVTYTAKELAKKNIIKILGNGRGTKYKLL